MIEISNITKVFHKGTTEVKPLNGVSLNVEDGKYLALMGPSGSGKTTLMNLIAGIDTPTSGSIKINGQEITTMSSTQLSKWRTRTIGYIFQLYHLIPVLTAYENVELPLTLLNMSAAERKARSQLVLDAVGLTDRSDHYPRQLSGGQEQRVAIARALVTDPQIILADEPTGDLDFKSAKDILNLIDKLHQDFKKTFVVVTHDPNVALRADRTVHLQKGVIVEDTQKAQN